MDRGLVPHWPDEKQFYPGQGHPHSAGTDPLPLQTHFDEKQR